MVACNKRVNEGGSQMTFLTWSFVVCLAKSKPIQYPERQNSSSMLAGQVFFLIYSVDVDKVNSVIHLSKRTHFNKPDGESYL